MSLPFKSDSDEAFGLAAETAGLRGESIELVSSMSGLDFGIAARDTSLCDCAAVDAAMAWITLRAKLAYGTGRYPARLNFGEHSSCALA